MDLNRRASEDDPGSVHALFVRLLFSIHSSGISVCVVAGNNLNPTNYIIFLIFINAYYYVQLINQIILSTVTFWKNNTTVIVHRIVLSFERDIFFQKVSQFDARKDQVTTTGPLKNLKSFFV